MLPSSFHMNSFYAENRANTGVSCSDIECVARNTAQSFYLFWRVYGHWTLKSWDWISNNSWLSGPALNEVRRRSNASLKRPGANTNCSPPASLRSSVSSWDWYWNHHWLQNSSKLVIYLNIFITACRLNRLIPLMSFFSYSLIMLRRRLMKWQKRKLRSKSQSLPNLWQMHNLHSINIKQQTDPFGEGTPQKVGKSWVKNRNILNLRPLRFFTLSFWLIFQEKSISTSQRTVMYPACNETASTTCESSFLGDGVLCILFGARVYW